jgi:hypothetical protein
MPLNNLAQVRVLHAVPDAPNVDVYANGTMLAKNLAFGEITEYQPVANGKYEVTIYPAGTMDTPVVRQILTVKDNEALTVAATGTLSTISGLAITDSNQPIQNNNAMVRFIHLSPNAPAVDITLLDGTVLFRNVSYKQATRYIPVPPSTYTLQVRVANTPNVVLTVPDVALEENKYYTIYALGLVGDTPPLQALAVNDFSPV